MEAWQKRLNEVMSDLKKTYKVVRKEYEASDEGVFSPEEDHKINEALKFSLQVLNTFERTDYVGPARLQGWSTIKSLASGPMSLYQHHWFKKSVEEMVDLTHRGAVGMDRLNDVAPLVEAMTPDVYRPPRPTLGSNFNPRWILVSAGLVIGGAVVIGGVRGYRSVTRGY